jgi:hypothetical protein
MFVTEKRRRNVFVHAPDANSTFTPISQHTVAHVPLHHYAESFVHLVSHPTLHVVSFRFMTIAEHIKQDKFREKDSGNFSLIH